MTIKEKIKSILSEIKEVKLVAVTKTRTIEEIKEAIDFGVKIIGENKIQEAERKYNFLRDYFQEKKVEFHFIGHLQTNKAKKAVEMFDLIQSIDSLKLAQGIDKRAKEINKVQNILIEVKIGKEEQKAGVLPENVFDFIESIKKLNNLKLLGLMCIPPFSEISEDSRPHFREMKGIFDKLKLEVLSMGMTDDYRIAIEEGTNMIRIGRGIFGERKG